MSAQLIDGKQIAKDTREAVREEVRIRAERGYVPGLAVVIVGNNPASEVYVRNKHKACSEAGIYSEILALPEDCTEERLLSEIETLNGRPEIDGILVQLPLPPQIRESRVIAAISPDKDVDAFHDVNTGCLLNGSPVFLPCTPAGVMELLRASGVSPEGKHCVVVGRSNIVGKPMALLLLAANGTVTICHSRTKNLAEITRQADILVAAVGRADFITGEMIKPGAVVIDVGINRRADGKLTGDVEFASASEVASLITPVPGGVGPMTIAMLLRNTLTAADLHHTAKE
ncbi:MAG: bifunctional methylenetetrahydrofolate dehydrogenase/methenyltetrahydrofolate cyclohydrolase FolD [Clostridia bacterium]|nr:bifunctional methylenetetrahydrofolate dehydrogenase/methenyltetrahydrofolate cyclohydrolase FolD [Clostridia bacterium]